jgi:hypothetical protein
MNTMKLTFLLTVSLVLAGGPARAQLPAAGATGLNAAMTKLFGDVTAFSSQADVRLKENGGKDSLSLTMNFALLDGKMRAEIDMTQIKSAEVTAEAAASFKQMGMDKLVTIVRPDRKSTLLVYPTLRAYTEAPMSPQDAAELDGKYTVTKDKVGRETVDGHPCEKHKVTVTSEKGEKHEALVWYATDLKNFPVQMQMNQKDATVVMLYKDVKLAKPEANLFEAPAGFTKHESMEKLMQGAMMKMLGGAK